MPRIGRTSVALILAWALAGCPGRAPGTPADAATDAAGPDAAPVAEPLYLIFTDEPVDPPATSIDDGLSRYVDVLEANVGTARVAGRRLGFNIVVVPWSQSERDIDALIDAAFRVARARDVAVHVSIESHYEWSGHPDLWNYADPTQPGYDPANVANVEWTDWAGTPFPARVVDWGTPQRLAPHMCYGAARVRAEARRLATDVVGARLRTQLDALTTEGRAELFSGVTVTSEPSLDDYSAVAGVDPTLGAYLDAQGLPRARLGYCALTAAGYRATAPPADIDAALADANAAWVAWWATSLAEAGLPRTLLFTHEAGSSGVPGAAGLAFTHAPLSVAFAADATPGFTTYAWGPLDRGLGPLYDALASHGATRWASTEASLLSDTGAAVDAETYLRWHFDHGAVRVVMNAGATGTLGSALVAANWSDAAKVTYARFLRGELTFAR